MRCICIAGIHNLELSAAKMTVKIGKSISLTNDKDRILRVLKLCPNLPSTIGMLEMQSLLSGRPVAIADIEECNGETEYHVLDFLFSLQMLSTAFWIAHDSCIDTELGFAFEVGGMYKISSNMIKNGFTSSNCRKERIVLGYKSIEEIAEKYAEFDKDTRIALGNRNALTKDTNRLTRAMYHITGARAINVFEHKLADYCAAFEAMLSTSTSELAHQLSERIAILLGTGIEERLSTYRLIKQMYDIRSKVVHGATINPANMEELSREGDRIARSLFNKSMEAGELNDLLGNRDNKEIDEYFLRRLLA